MSDIKVVAWQEDVDTIESLIRERSGATETLSFPDGCISELPNMKDYLDRYVTGELTEYTFIEDVPAGIFQYSNIQKVNIPYGKTIKNYAFYHCDELTEISIPNVQTIKERAFSTCEKLAEISAPSVSYVGDYCFQDCNLLKKVSFPSLVTVEYLSFTNCFSLERIELPCLKTIGYYAFDNCYSLETVIASAAMKIGFGAFKYTNLCSLVIEQDTSICRLLGTDAFSETPISNGTGFIYVPDSLVDAYKAETNWSTFADQIKPLSEYSQD